MRWLLVKDLQILRRSPLLVVLLIVYPVVIALMIGFALSSPPGKPKVAFYSEVAPGKGNIKFGTQQINVSHYASELFESIQPIIVHSRDEAVAKVRDGKALAALIVPGDIVGQIQTLVTQGVGNPTVELVLNSKDPLDRQFAQQAINNRLAQVEQAVSKQVLHAAVADLHLVLSGGGLQFAGQTVQLLGLRNARAIVSNASAQLPAHSRLAPALRRVVSFANLAIDGLGLATPVLGSIGKPLTVVQTQLAGRTTPTDSYAAAIAVIISLMIITLLLGAGMLAIERAENTYPRLVRGLVSPEGLLSEKVVLAAGCAALLAMAMAMLVSLFVHLDWGRFPLWAAALAFGGLAFGALGVALGGIAKELSTASLMAILLSLPIAFVALVPASAVSGTIKSLLDVLAFLFPFKPALQAANNAFSASSPGIGWPLVHLALLTLFFGGLARIALRRFA